MFLWSCPEAGFLTANGHCCAVSQGEDRIDGLPFPFLKRGVGFMACTHRRAIASDREVMS